MKKKILQNNSVLVILVCSLFIFMLSSCTKKEEDITKSDKTGEDITQFKESNEDFLTVDYSYFYGELSTKGEWIEISAKDLGLDVKAPKTSELIKDNMDFIAEVFGVKTAYAQTGEDIVNLYVWRPTKDLAETMIKESDVKEYVPFNNGQWIYTDAGWYFKADTPQEEITSHYGRWTEDENLGYVWLPGKTWSPAWVEMRENQDYVAWAPIPPGTYLEGEKISQTQINENRYTIVEKKQFIEPSVYKYRYQNVENKNKIMIKEMTKTEGVMVKNKTVINKGPDVADIEKHTGKKIETVKIDKAGKKEDAGYKGNVINIFNPELKKSSEAKKEPVSKPEKLVSYKDAKKITKEEKEDRKSVV